MKQFPLDPPCFEGEEAIEILRIWLDNGPLSVCHKFALLPRISNDVAAWGIILVDIARHVAHAYATSEPQSEKAYFEVLNRIKEGFDAEWGDPTDQSHGCWENVDSHEL